MKFVKKITAFALVAIMVLATIPVAFAVNVGNTFLGTGSGSITISNAEKEASYSIVRAFDATYSTYTDGDTQKKTVSYTVSNPALINLIKAENSANLDSGVCPFKLVTKVSESPEKWAVEHKNMSSQEAIDKGRAWLAKHFSGVFKYNEGTQSELALPGWGDSAPTMTLECESGTSLTFSNIPYGYYLIFNNALDFGTIGTDGGAVVTVNSATPSVTVIDKNTREPSSPDKKVDDPSVQVGDTPTYTASFKATNFYTASSSSTDRIINYTVTDVATGVEFDRVISIKLYKTQNQDGSFANEINYPNGIADTTSPNGIEPYDETTHPYGYSVTTTAGVEATSTTPGTPATYTTTFTIPWAKNTAASGATPVYESLYADTPVYVVITYTAKTDNDIIYNGNKAHNTATTHYTTQSGQTVDLDSESADIYTTGISVRKLIDGTDTILGNTGELDSKFAKFKLYQKDKDGNKSYYKWDAEKECVTWVTEAAAVEDDPDTEENESKPAVVGDIAKADNNYGTMEFKGLDAGTYYLEEVQAPDGYEVPDYDFEVVLTYNPNATTDGTRYSGTVTPLINKNGQNSPTTNGVEGQSNVTYKTVKIYNTNKDPLPSTGGAGTLAFIVIGTLAFLAACVILVTKKRMYNEG